MAEHLTGDQIEHFRHVFSTFDQDGGGSISSSELGCCLRALGQNPGPKEIEKILKLVDQDGSGSIDFEEFLTFVVHKVSSLDEQATLMQCFEMLDPSESGFVRQDELVNILCNSPNGMTPQEVDAMIKEFEAFDNESGVPMINYVSIVKGLLSV